MLLNNASTFIEICYEICNKQGGIHQVVTSKAPSVQRFSLNHVLIGPLLSHNKQKAMLMPLDKECPWSKLEQDPVLESIDCVVGKWCEAPSAIVILVNSKSKNLLNNPILQQCFERYPLEYACRDGYVTNAVSFANAYVVLLTVMLKKVVLENTSILFHEWQAGAGIQQLQKLFPELKMRFQLHATQLGRVALYYPDHKLSELRYDTLYEGHRKERWLKHVIEQSAVAHCDELLALSDLQSKESKILHGRAADLIVANGLPSAPLKRNNKTREALHKVVENFFRSSNYKKKDIRIIYTSGRHEHDAKGFDLFSFALAKLERVLREKKSNMHVYVIVVAENKNISGGKKADKNGALADFFSKIIKDRDTSVFLHNKKYWTINNPLIEECEQYDLHKAKHLSVIYTPMFLDENDDELPISYKQLLQSADLGVFLSRYEPWGYCPQECLSAGVPTIASQQCGFTDYMNKNYPKKCLDYLYTVDVEDEKEKLCDQVAQIMYKFLKENRHMESDYIDFMRAHFNWNNLLKNKFSSEGASAYE